MEDLFGHEQALEVPERLSPEQAVAFRCALNRILRSAPPATRKSAKTFHDLLHRRLIESGYSVHREYRVEGGVIDLVILRPFRIGLELDNRSPRIKSLRKLGTFGGLGVVLLRNPLPEWEEINLYAAPGK